MQTPARFDQKVLHHFSLTVLMIGIFSGAYTTKGHAQDSNDANSRTTSFRIPPGSEDADSHPLQPLVVTARENLRYLGAQVHDYTCYLVKRERIDGELLDTEHMSVKFREGRQGRDGTRVPLSIYMKMLAPKRVRGREVLYVKGQQNGDMLVTNGGRRGRYLTLSVDPYGDLAMRDNRYPITEFGFRNLADRLLQIVEHDLQFRECDVKVYRGAKVDGRSCTAYEVTHPHRRGHFYFHKARVFLDDELKVPIRYAAYDWPANGVGDPLLTEEYTFRDVKINVGLTNEDFSHRNPKYRFHVREDNEE